MPNLPDIPGKDLVAGTSRRARKIAVAAGSGVLAVGGFLARRVRGGPGGTEPEVRPAGGADNGEVASAIADPGIAVEPPPKPKAAKPRPAKPKPPKPKAAKPSTAKPPKPKAVKPKREPGDQRGGKDPHHALNNPVADPDPTEYPDPFDKREDPRDPVDPDGMPFGEEPHPQTGAESTSEPPPAQDPEVGDRAKPPRRDNLDD